MARWSPEPEVSQEPLPLPVAGASLLSAQPEGGRHSPGPLVVPAVSTGESILSGTNPNQLRRHDPPSTIILSPPRKGSVDRIYDLSMHESQPRLYPTSSSVEWLQNRIVPEETGSIQRWGGRAPAQSVNREREWEQLAVVSTSPSPTGCTPIPLPVLCSANWKAVCRRNSFFFGGGCIFKSQTGKGSHF